MISPDKPCATETFSITGSFARIAKPQATATVKGKTVPIYRSYSDVAIGKPLALVGSANLLEIAVREGSAQKKLKLKVGDEVVLK